jgi:outer membrane lipoprotein-sorting protein
MLKKTASWPLAAAASLLVGLAAVAMTADEVLDRMEAESDKLAEGSMVAVMRFETTYSYGDPVSYTLGMLSKPDYSLIYFIGPELDAGTMYLFVDEEIDGEKEARFWMYLPVLGSPKELITEEDLSGGFAGSSLSLSDIGGEDRRSDYEATLVREESLVIGEETRTAFVVESIAEPDVETDTPRTILWVDTESFVMLKMEAYNDLGKLDTTIEVVSLTEFEGIPTYAEMLTTSIPERTSTTITVLERHRPDADIPDAVFVSENLPAFDPEEWGF